MYTGEVEVGTGVHVGRVYNHNHNHPDEIHSHVACEPFTLSFRKKSSGGWEPYIYYGTLHRARTLATSTNPPLHVEQAVGRGSA